MLVFIHREISGEVYSLLELVHSILPSVRLLHVLPQLRLIDPPRLGPTVNVPDYIDENILELLYLLRECSDRLLVASHLLHRSGPGISSQYTLDIVQNYVP